MDAQLEQKPEQPPPPTEKTAIRRARTPTKYSLPSERFQFQAHVDVMARFVSLSRNGSEAVPAPSVEDGQTVKKQSASLNTGFLTSIGLLTEDSKGRFLPTEKGKQFVLTRTASDERARPILRSVIESQWFAEGAKLLLQTKQPITEDDLVTELALLAQTDRGKKEAALRVLVEYLVYAGIVVRTERGLVAGNSVLAPPVPVPFPVPVSMPVKDMSAWSPPEAGVVPAQLTAPASAAGSPGPISVRFALGPILTPTGVVEWKTLQTDDFVLKVRANGASIASLKKHLAILEEELPESKPTGSGSVGADPAVHP
jgi:hypothetical protein